MRLIDAENIENFAHEETFGSGDMIENWIAEIDIPIDVKIEYEENLKELCWKALEGCMNVIKTEPTVSAVDKDAEEETEERHSNGWIPCSERMPKNEQEVEITFIRTDPRTGEKLYLTARAFHEDGTMREDDSCYLWEAEVYCDYDTEKECYIVPEGWFEDVSFAESFERISEEQIIAWKPTSEPYREDDLK